MLSLYVIEMTGSAALFASMLSVSYPRILLTPLAGVMADRVKKIRLMSLILLGEELVLWICFLLGQTVTAGIALIYVLVVVLEADEIFYGGCGAAILPEPEKALREIDRVLRPGGILIAPNFVEHKGTLLSRIWSGILALAGVRFEHQWTGAEYLAWLEEHGWHRTFSK